MTGGSGPAADQAADRVGDRWCAVVLAAGLGTRLRPLTDLRPKALCPVGNRPILDRVLGELAALGLRGPDDVAVNASWRADQLTEHLTAGGRPRATVSVERPTPLGTGGGVARLREWIDGRAVLVANADAYRAPPLAPDGAQTAPGGTLAELVAGWDGGTVRLLGVPAPAGTVDAFSGYRFAGCSLLPWQWVTRLPPAPTPSELVTEVWRPAEAACALTVTPLRGTFIDTGTVSDYLAANLHAAARPDAPGVRHPDGSLIAVDAEVDGDCEASVIGAGARVRGRLTRAVVWPGGEVGPDEHLVDAVRADAGVTVTAGGAPTTPTPP